MARWQQVAAAKQIKTWASRWQLAGLAAGGQQVAAGRSTRPANR